jgi:hypothetical protein
MSDDSPETKAYPVALQTRSFEIELFWKRALFFWAFVAAAFAAFASTSRNDPAVALVVAGFGTACSVAWTLANRGSKYWQETWESRVEALEKGVTGPLFSLDTPVRSDGVRWLRARRFSVSKLTIALTDFIAVLWSLLAAGQLLRLLGYGPALHRHRGAGAVIFAVLVSAYIGAMVRWCRTTERKRR